MVPIARLLELGRGCHLHSTALGGRTDNNVTVDPSESGCRHAQSLTCLRDTRTLNIWGDCGREMDDPKENVHVRVPTFESDRRLEGDR